MWDVASPVPFVAKVSCPYAHYLISCLLQHTLLSKNAVLLLQSVQRVAADVIFLEIVSYQYSLCTFFQLFPP